MRVFFGVILMLGGVASCAAEPGFQVKGYFKSDANDRIFSVVLPPEFTPEQVQEFARDRPYTAGQMTAVYFYDAGASAVPADGLTQARSVPHANAVLDLAGLSAWRFVYMRWRNGEAEFVDCTRQGHDLCRNKG